MKLSEELQWRGFIQQTTFSDLSQLDAQTWTFYHGFDASADSQTIGNLAAMMFDKVFMRHGHRAILLAGGATSLIGDPGGKDKERELQDEKTINQNVKNAERQLAQIFGDHGFKLVNNLDWTKNMTVLDFLRDIGKHFSMTPLVQRDYIAKRLGEGGAGISYAEFSYTLLQGMDFLHLYDTHKCTLQLGGSDQWGNCLSGVELIRKARGAEAHVITLPLIINKATGKKFGKSEEGAVWLDPQKTSPFRFYQFWLNVDDEGVEDYLKVYTELDKRTIEDLISKHRQDLGLRTAQQRLAKEVTAIVHGVERAKSVERISQALFGGQPLSELNSDDFDQIAAELPVFEFQAGKELIEAAVEAGLASSKTEARRFWQDKAFYINNIQIDDSVSSLSIDQTVRGYIVLRRGRNASVLIRIK